MSAPNRYRRNCKNYYRKERPINVFAVVRIFIGGIFVVSGFEKLIGPYQNFLYVIQSYDVFAPTIELLIAKFFPWVELFVGTFLVLGLWIKPALYAAWGLLLGFIWIVSQAISRQLPIDECGCFGELISLPLSVVLMIDVSILAVVFLLLFKLAQTSRLSLDKYFSS